MKIQLQSKILTHVDGTQPPGLKDIFVFGSNTAGLHAGGAALAAELHYGAKSGVAEGMAGRSYAIPTVDFIVGKGKVIGRRTISVADIAQHVETFRRYVDDHPNKMFFITRVGCVIAGHSDKEIAPLFAPAQENCNYPKEWEKFLG